MTNTTKLVDMLYDAYNSKQPISKDAFPKNVTQTEAYDIQHRLTDKKAAKNNDKLIGYKISLTSEETQQLFHSTTPLYGALTQSSLSKETIELDEMLSPLVEIELMFRANEDISATDDEQSILEKTSIAPGMEIPDSRFTDWFPKVSLGQVIADSAVAGKIVVGEPIDGLTYDQLNTIHATLKLDEETIAEGSSSEVLGNPIHAIKWLVDELAKTGRTITKGMIISSGTFILPKELKKGTYRVEFEKAGGVSLQVN